MDIMPPAVPAWASGARTLRPRRPRPDHPRRVIPRGSGVPEPLPAPGRGSLGQDRVADRDVGGRQAAVPEQDRLLLTLPARPHPADDLAKFGVTRVLGQFARLDLGARRA